MMLSPTDIQRVETAIAAAERHTRGEIVVAEVDRSSDYLTFRLKSAIFLLVFLEALLAALAVMGKLHLPPYETMAIQWGLAAFVFGILSRPAVLRLVLPKGLRDRKVRARTMAKFLEHNVHATREHTGVLILLSVLERRVEILVDRGCVHVPADFWNAQADAIAAGLKSRQPAPALVGAIGAIATRLAEALPPSPDGNRNELSNTVRH